MTERRLWWSLCCLVNDLPSDDSEADKCLDGLGLRCRVACDLGPDGFAFAPTEKCLEIYQSNGTELANALEWMVRESNRNEIHD